MLVAQNYQEYFKQKGIDAQLLSLEEIDMTKRNEKFELIESKYLIPTEKFVFVVPEYNGTFPGIMKLMIDMCQMAKCWHGKKVMLTGLATGRSGNLRGLDMMSNMFHYLKVDVSRIKVPLAAVDKELENGVFIKEETINLIDEQINHFIKF